MKSREIVKEIGNMVKKNKLAELLGDDEDERPEPSKARKTAVPVALLDADDDEDFTMLKPKKTGLAALLDDDDDTPAPAHVGATHYEWTATTGALVIVCAIDPTSMPAWMHTRGTLRYGKCIGDTFRPL